MSLPRALDPSLTEALAVPAPAAPPPPAASGPRAAARRGARRVAGLVLRTARARVRPRAVRFVALETAGVREQAETATARLDELEERLAALQQDRASQEVLRGHVQAATVNLELLKGEVRHTGAVLDRLGMAIAPATGVDGAEVRMAELRERVNGLDRRLRTLTDRGAGAPGPAGGEASGSPSGSPSGGPSGSASGGPVVAASPVRSALFDYVGFERRFRGDPAEVLAVLDERYGALLAAHAPVLDVGCGRAELLALLRDRGVAALGVDTDPSMVAEAQAQGLEVHEVDAVSYLRGVPEGSLGAVIATHVVEHLELDELIELLELAATRLRPGGVLVAETPNPQSLIVLGNSYLLDPTHVRPLHPSLLAFLCEGAGFRSVELRFFSPATGYHLATVDDPDAPPWVQTVNEGFAQLNRVLFGPQDYAVVATAAPREGADGEGTG